MSKLDRLRQYAIRRFAPGGSLIGKYNNMNYYRGSNDPNDNNYYNENGDIIVDPTIITQLRLMESNNLLGMKIGSGVNEDGSTYDIFSNRDGEFVLTSGDQRTFLDANTLGGLNINWDKNALKELNGRELSLGEKKYWNSLTQSQLADLIENGAFANGGLKNSTEYLQYKDTKRKLMNQAATDIAAKAFGVNVIDDSKLDKGSQVAMGAVGKVVSAGAQMLSDATLQSENYSAQSLAIDGAVHGISDRLMNSGNPFAMIAAGGIEAINYISKAGGLTVQGYDVNINSSGYGKGLAHQDSVAHRSVLGTLLGIPVTGPVQLAKLNKELEERNEKALMALNAANIADRLAMNTLATENTISINDTLHNNQVALSGGINVQALAAKRGARLTKLGGYLKDIYGKPHKIKQDLTDGQENGSEPIITTDNKKWFLDGEGYLVPFENAEKIYNIEKKKVSALKAQNGAKLRLIEVSEPNILPTGAMHKDKNHLTGLKDEITSKGIPVVTVDDDSIDTYEEVLDQKDSIVQHAEIERTEQIFSKALTEYLEQAKDSWLNSNKQDNDLLLEVGKRITKELLFNTIDEDKVIKTAMKNGKN